VYALVGQKTAAPLQPDVLRSNLGRLDQPGLLSREVWLQNIPLAAYAGNLAAARALFTRYPLSTDDRRPLEYSAPRTERNSKATQGTPVLAWLELARFCARLLEASPPATDPYLAQVSPSDRRQVPAGLAYYRYASLRRLGRTQEAQEALAEYRALVARP
jgi:hypothetical protein